MKTSVLQYTVVIQREGTYYIAHVPTLGISDFGSTIDSAKEHVKQAIACHIEGLEKSGSDIPAPDTHDVYVGLAEISVPKAIRFTIP